MKIQEKCPDCGTLAGDPHEDQCDVQRCSICGRQWITCRCNGHNPMRSAWTGDFPRRKDVAESVKPRQFDFARHWRKKIAPILDDPSIVHALTFGMGLFDKDYRQGDPPWEFGRGPVNGQRARQGCLSWYQPWGRCHYIAPFCWALGKRLYPEKKWGFISSDIHTVAIGYSDNWDQPECVMDILNFREMAADESLDFAKSKAWRFQPSLARYAASFCTDPEVAFEAYGEHFASQ